MLSKLANSLLLGCAGAFKVLLSAWTGVDWLRDSFVLRSNWREQSRLISPRMMKGRRKSEAVVDYNDLTFEKAAGCRMEDHGQWAQHSSTMERSLLDTIDIKAQDG